MSDGFSLGDVILAMFWFMLLCSWIWLLIAVLADIFRDTALSGWGKALWTLFLIALPWLGALVYLLARGRSMNERTATRGQREDLYFRGPPAGPSTADELSKLARLRERGAITESDYRAAKAQLLAPAAAPGSAQ
jgi:Short C-terminal domain/Phospholipase_D-nuclease N-terminal